MGVEGGSLQREEAFPPDHLLPDKLQLKTQIRMDMDMRYGCHNGQYNYYYQNENSIHNQPFIHQS